MEILRTHEEEWNDGRLADLAVFGSVARDEARPESDVDFLLAFARPSGLLDLVRFKLLFEDLLGRRVDVVTPLGLKPTLREEVLQDAVSVRTARVPDRKGPRRKRWRWRVEEMVARLERVQGYVTGLEYEAFLASDVTRDAVLLNLLQVGEAVSYLPDEVRLLHPDVPWAELRQVRHLIAHDYFGLDWSLVWHTLQHDLPRLIAQLRRVAQKYPPERAGT